MVSTGKWETEEKMGQPWRNQGGELSDLKAQPLAEEAPFIWLLEGDREEGLYGKPGIEEVGMEYLALFGQQKKYSWSAKQ